MVNDMFNFVEKELKKVYSNTTATADNFHHNSTINFTTVTCEAEKAAVLALEPIYTSPGASGGKYYVIGETLYRLANHWGSFKSVKWALDGRLENECFNTPTTLAKVNFADITITDMELVVVAEKVVELPLTTRLINDIKKGSNLDAVKKRFQKQVASLNLKISFYAVQAQIIAA